MQYVLRNKCYLIWFYEWENEKAEKKLTKHELIFHPNTPAKRKRHKALFYFSNKMHGYRYYSILFSLARYTGPDLCTPPSGAMAADIIKSKLKEKKQQQKARAQI